MVVVGNEVVWMKLLALMDEQAEVSAAIAVAAGDAAVGAADVGAAAEFSAVESAVIVVV